MNISHKIPKDFLSAEIRSDYYISHYMKKVWAVEIDLLCELLDVCKRHNLKIFANSGTTLGTIRHTGFIPWDDDIDMAMPRKDYQKLQAIAKYEFKHPYFFQDENTDPGSLTGHGRLINLSTTGINKYHLNTKTQGICRFKQCIFIDIFAYDNIPNQTSEKDKFFDKVYEMGLSVWNESKIKNRNLPINNPNQKYSFAEYENYLSKYIDSPTEWTYCFAMGKHNFDRWKLKTSEFDKIISKDFEFIQIPVLSSYNDELNRGYGNWREYVMGASDHGDIGDIFFDTEHPCEYYLDNPTRMKEIKQKFGIND